MKLISFYVKSLFTSIPVTDLLDISKGIINFFLDNKISDIKTRPELKIALKERVIQNYFVFNGNSVTS